MTANDEFELDENEEELREAECSASLVPKKKENEENKYERIFLSSFF